VLLEREAERVRPREDQGRGQGGRDRFDCFSAALRLLGWELRERRRTRERENVPGNTIAWSHLPAEPDTPGLLRIGGDRDPRLV
jgi:hypothetical protein